MPRRGNLFTSSLASGFIFGFLSGLPILQLLNCLTCCSFIVAAGAFCSYLLVKGSDVPVSWGRAAVGGLFAGVFSVPVMLITHAATAIILGGDLARDFEDAIRQAAEMSPEAQEAARILQEIGVLALYLIFGGLLFVTNTIVGTIGGLIGRAIFERRTTVPPAVPRTSATPAVPPDPGPPPPPPVQPS